LAASHLRGERERDKERERTREREREKHSLAKEFEGTRGKEEDICSNTVPPPLDEIYSSTRSLMHSVISS